MNIWTLIWTFVLFLSWFSSFSPSERVALAAAFLVLIGVIGEYVIEVPTVEKRESLKARIKGVSMALLLLGLSGDILGVVMGQSEMAALTKEAGDASKSAKDAAQDAKSAHAVAQSASEIAGGAEKTSKGANAEASEAQHAASAVGKEVSLAQKQLSKIRLYTAHRFIDTKSITDATKPYSGTAWVIRYSSDIDSELLAQQLMIALSPAGAGWKPAFWQHISPDEAAGGTEVYVDHADGLTGVPNPEPGCKALVKAMAANFVGPTRIDGTRHPVDPNLVVITIGRRDLEWAPPSKHIKELILNREEAAAQNSANVNAYDPCAP